MYKSPRRAQQARATRQVILNAADDLFKTRGYIQTSIREIAERAGVAVPTVYAIFKDKASVLWALVELIVSGGEAESFDDSEVVIQMRAEPDFRRRLDIAVSWGVRIMEMGIGDIEASITQAAAIDPRYQSLLRQGDEKRRKNDRLIVQLLLDVAQSKPELSLDELAEMIGAVFNAATYRTLVNECGWTREKYEQSMLGIVKGLLLGSSD